MAQKNQSEKSERGPCAYLCRWPGAPAPMEMVKIKDLGSHRNGRKKNTTWPWLKRLGTWVLKQISFAILNELFLLQLWNGNNVRLVCGWMDVLDYRCSYVMAAGITQGLGVNSLHSGWICWDDKVVVSRFTQHKLQASPHWVITLGGFSLSVLPNFMRSPGPAVRRHQVKLIRQKNMRRKAGSTQTVHLSCYICAPVAACKKSYDISPCFCSLDPVSAALSSISCSTLGS